jgi:hypothetical protein
LRAASDEASAVGNPMKDGEKLKRSLVAHLAIPKEAQEKVLP